MIRKKSEENKINFLENSLPEKNSSDLDSIKESKKSIEIVMEEQKSKKLNNKDDGYMNGNHIFSARTGEIKNEGGPNKHIKLETSNTIWDSDKTSKLSSEIDSKTKTRLEKEEILTNRRTAEQKRIDEMVENLKSTDLTKANSVVKNAPLSGSNYKSLKSSISIFDSGDFERLEEKTRGEEIAEINKQKRSQKDESWKNSGKNFSSKDIVNNLFNNLFDKE